MKTKDIVLFVSTSIEAAKINAISYDNTACLITNKNFDNVLNSKESSQTIYTTLSEFDHENNFWKLLFSVDKIFYDSPGDLDILPYSAEKIFSSEQSLLEYMLFTVNSNNQNVENFTAYNKFINQNYIKLIDERKTQDPQLWISGCSIADGEANKPEDSFGYRIGEALGLKVSWLSLIGSSNPWQADQICRSDIRKDDVIVWALTHPQRYTVWHESNDFYYHINSRIEKNHDYQQLELSKRTVQELILHKTQFYNTITAVHRVKNFCNKVGAKLLIFSAIPTFESDYQLGWLPEFKIYKTENNIFPKYIDKGTDGSHPGPLQHKAYAEWCLKHLKTMYNL